MQSPGGGEAVRRIMDNRRTHLRPPGAPCGMRNWCENRSRRLTLSCNCRVERCVCWATISTTLWAEKSGVGGLMPPRPTCHGIRDRRMRVTNSLIGMFVSNGTSPTSLAHRLHPSLYPAGKDSYSLTRMVLRETH